MVGENRDRSIVFAIDCDEVLRALVPKMIELYNANFNENLKYEDIKHFDVDISFPKVKEVLGVSASDWFFQDHSEDLFATANAFPSIKEDIELLQRYGRVIILTHQKTYKNKLQTLNWLEEHGIHPDGIAFLKDKTLLRCTYLIDDNDWNFTGGYAQTGVLIDAPYNKDIDLDTLKSYTHCAEMIRCKSLHDFVKYFKAKMDKEVEGIMNGFAEKDLKCREALALRNQIRLNEESCNSKN